MELEITLSIELLVKEEISNSIVAQTNPNLKFVHSEKV